MLLKKYFTDKMQKNIDELHFYVNFVRINLI